MDKKEITVGAKLKCVSNDHLFIKQGELVTVELIDCAPYRSQRSVKFDGVSNRSYIDNVVRCFEVVT